MDKQRLNSKILIGSYLGAIVGANLIISAVAADPVKRAIAVVVVPVFFIGFDLTARDFLHENWKGKNLFAKMFVLILAGSTITAALNLAAARIALASFIAFFAAGVVDFYFYRLLGVFNNQRRRVNGSNIYSAAVDSLLFPTIAFGAFLPGLIVGQFAAKTIGGWVWFEILNKIRKG